LKKKKIQALISSKVTKKEGLSEDHHCIETHCLALGTVSGMELQRRKEHFSADFLLDDDQA
jgi:hypothetical protein